MFLYFTFKHVISTVYETSRGYLFFIKAEENLARNHLPWITNDVIERLYITRQTISFLLSPS